MTGSVSFLCNTTETQTTALKVAKSSTIQVTPHMTEQQQRNNKKISQVVGIAEVLHWIALDLEGFSRCCVHLHILREAIFDKLTAVFVLVYGLPIRLA